MKIVPQKGKFNQFNIENLSLARINAIVSALQFANENKKISVAGSQLLKQLESSNIETLKLNN